MPTVTLADREVRIEPFSGRKATRVLRLLSDIGKQAPELLRKRAEFRHEYSQQNVLTLSRADAHARYGDRLQHMTEADWDASEGVVKIAALPSWEEELVALWPDALDSAEHLVVQLLALLQMGNADVKRYARDGSLNGPEGKLAEIGDDLLDEDAAQLLELAVVASEAIDGQFRAKVEGLGDRLGNLGQLFGIGRPKGPAASPTTTNATTSPTPNSSTDTPGTGSETEPSTSPTADSPT